MQCPKCGERWYVAQTVHAEWSPSGTKVRDYSREFREQKDGLYRWAQESVGWYSQDFVARLRKCKACGEQARSIEIIEEDMPDLLRSQS